MGRHSQIDQQVPDHVVVAESLPGVKPRAERIEHAARGDQRQQRRRRLPHEKRHEKYDRPPHDQIDRQAEGGNRLARKRLVEDAEQHPRPLQDRDEDALPPSDHRQRDRRIASGDGDVDENMVEDMEHGLVFRGRIHRMVERRSEKHQEDRDHENAHRHRRQNAVGVVRVGPHGRKGKRHERQQRHHAVRDRIGDLLPHGRDISILFLRHNRVYWSDVPNL